MDTDKKHLTMIKYLKNAIVNMEVKLKSHPPSLDGM